MFKFITDAVWVGGVTGGAGSFEVVIASSAGYYYTTGVDSSFLTRVPFAIKSIFFRSSEDYPWGWVGILVDGAGGFTSEIVDFESYGLASTWED